MAAQAGSAELTARQAGEQQYHAAYAAKHRDLASTPVDLSICQSPQRRPWNAYWSLYDRLIALAPELKGQRVLVPGCGFGEDCIRLAALGADVHGIDLSPEIIDVAEQRARRFARAPITFGKMPCEALNYPDQSFDAVVLVNILHHVSVPDTMREVYRVAKPGARILGLEMYTHSVAQRVRNSSLVAKGLYPRIQSFVYGSRDPYITPDERKLDESEMSVIVGRLKALQLAYFSFLSERIFPNSMTSVARLDLALARLLGGSGRFFAGRVLFTGVAPPA